MTGVQLEKRGLEDRVWMLRQRFPSDRLQMSDVNRIADQFDHFLGVGHDSTIFVEQSDVEHRHLVTQAVDNVVFDV